MLGSQLRSSFGAMPVATDTAATSHISPRRSIHFLSQEQTQRLCIDLRTHRQEAA
jgi:hypothetical protein